MWVVQERSHIVVPQVNSVLQVVCGSQNTGAVSLSGIGKKYTKRVSNSNSTRTMAHAANGVNAASAVAADPKLQSMRTIMKNVENGVDAFIVPSEDPHMVCVYYNIFALLLSMVSNMLDNDIPFLI